MKFGVLIEEVSKKLEAAGLGKLTVEYNTGSQTFPGKHVRIYTTGDFSEIKKIFDDAKAGEYDIQVGIKAQQFLVVYKKNNQELAQDTEVSDGLLSKIKKTSEEKGTIVAELTKQSAALMSMGCYISPHNKSYSIYFADPLEDSSKNKFQTLCVLDCQSLLKTENRDPKKVTELLSDFQKKFHDEKYFLTPKCFYLSEPISELIKGRFHLLYPEKIEMLDYLDHNFLYKNSSSFTRNLERQYRMQLFLQLVEAVAYLHNTIRKPHGSLSIFDTVFLDPQENSIKVLNFDIIGLSEKVHDTVLPSDIDAVYWGAEKYQTSVQRSFESDIWRLGVIFLQFLIGHTLFENSSSKNTAISQGSNFFERIEEKSSEQQELALRDLIDDKLKLYDSHNTLSEKERQLIKKMLVINPAGRIKINDLLKEVSALVKLELVGNPIIRARHEKTVIDANKKKQGNEKNTLKDALGEYNIAREVLSFFNPAIIPKKEGGDSQSKNEPEQQNKKGSPGSLKK